MHSQSVLLQICVSDPDWIRSQLGQRIRIGNPDSDQGRPKIKFFVLQHEKNEEISFLKSLNVLWKDLGRHIWRFLFQKISISKFYKDVISKILVSVRIRIWIRNQLQAGSGSGSGFSKIPGSGSGFSEYGSKTLLLIQGFRSKLKIVRYRYIKSGGLLPHQFFKKLVIKSLGLDLDSDQ
jgi:hypothetical protein